MHISNRLPTRISHLTAIFLLGLLPVGVGNAQQTSAEKPKLSPGEAYDRYMGRWSALLAREFVGFSGLRDGDAVLDVGCGTGILTAAVIKAAPTSTVAGIDPDADYVKYAQSRFGSDRVCLEIGDAQKLRFANGAFQQTLSLLVINFVPDPGKGLDEMIRVTRPGGVIAAAVWDYGGDMEMLRIFWDEAVKLDPKADAKDQRHAPLCRKGELAALWRKHGLMKVEEQGLTIKLEFASFNDYWQPFLLGQRPGSAFVTSLPTEQRTRLEQRLRARLLPDGKDRPFALRARAWAVKGIVPER